MKRFLLYLIITVGISAVAAVPIASARMGGGGGGGAPVQQGGGGGHWGGDHGGGFHDGGSHDHGHFRGGSSFFFYGDFGYPYYGWPYYYDYPPYYYYDDYYAPRYYYDYGPSVNYSSRAPAYRVDDTRSYLTLGHDSGKGLKRKDVTWNWFVEYLQAYIVNAPTWARDDYHRGFVSGYGDGAEAIYKKGIQQAQQPRPASNENAPSSEPNPSVKQN